MASNKTGNAISVDRNGNRTIIVENSADNFPWADLAPIALLAFQTGGQVIASRVLKVASMPTVVLTTLFADLMGDAKLFALGLCDHPDRVRRAGGAISLFVGAIIGGVLSNTSIGISGVLWIAAAIKGLMVVSWLLWRSKA